MGESGEYHDKCHVSISITDSDLGSSLTSDLHEYLRHIMKSTNMGCLTPDAAISGECDFLSANLCARSVFGNSTIGCKSLLADKPGIIGEDALANVSLEKTEEGSITGHVRIRSKTQGIALSLGDKITQGS